MLFRSARPVAGLAPLLYVPVMHDRMHTLPINRPAECQEPLSKHHASPHSDINEAPSNPANDLGGVGFLTRSPVLQARLRDYSIFDYCKFSHPYAPEPAW